MRLFPLLALAGLTFIVDQARANPGPEAFKGLPQSSYALVEPGRLVSADARSISIPAGKQLFQFNVASNRQHANGDMSFTGNTADHGGFARVTIGASGAFGEVRSNDSHWVITSDQSGTWLVEMPAEGFVYNSCTVSDLRHKQLATSTLNAAGSRDESHPEDSPGTVIDLLIIYTPALAERYPGDLMDTRLNYLVDIGNQTTGNTELDLGFRLVGTQLFDYTDANGNPEALNDIIDTLDGNEREGLEGLEELRDSLGADLVIMLRPHDIEIRGNCGNAPLPQYGPSAGANVVSDGMSSWSVCLDDVLTHEIGHNLGALHQAELDGGQFDPRGAALVRPGQFSTIMGSYGTGRPDRFRGLPVFSSPLVQCGGVLCGASADTDNAAVIRDYMETVADYQPASSPVALPEALPRSDDDSDGDGVIDWDDLFPFDPSETADRDFDLAGNASDDFPTDPAEQLDTDGDGVGNNADPDDDGDFVNDVNDAFPLDENEDSDDDSDGVGNNADAFPKDESEFDDFDGDDIGNHRDLDDDDDGFEEFERVAEDILVISTGNDRILRFDADTGEPRGIEVPPSDGVLTFQSDLAWRQTDHTLHYLSRSSIRRMNLLNRDLLGEWVPAYDDEGTAGVALDTGFPTALEALSGGDRLITTRMGNATLRGFEGQETALQDPLLNWSVSQGESPIDVVEHGNTALVLGQASQAIYEVDNQGFTYLSPPGSDWMEDPRFMQLSGDGRLFVSDTGRDAVVAIDLETGDFLGDFISLKDHGYRDPTGLALSRNGELLVAAQKNNAILAFDAVTGEFLDERVSKGSWGLRQPHAMILVPRLLDRLNDHPDRVIRPNAGLWFNPATNGRGFDIQVYGKRLSAIWYTYDTQGLPLWYLSSGELEGFEYNGPIQRFSMDNEGRTSSEDVGNLQLVFASERRAEMSFNIGATFGGEPLQWQEISSDESINDYTGLWGRRDGPGWGLSMATQGDTTIAIAFIYDLGGEPRWVLSKPVTGPSPHTFDMNAYFSSTLCPRCSGESEFEIKPAGTMDLQLEDDATWSSDIVFPAPMFGEWNVQEEPVIRFSNPPERPR